MAFKMTLWACALLFVATVYNVIGAYDAMGSVDVQSRFQQVGLLEGQSNGEYPLPLKKPLQIRELASNE